MMAGGLMAIPKPSLMLPIIAPVSLPDTAAALLAGSVLSDQSFSVMKPKPMFWPEPAKLKPDTPRKLSTSGILVMISLAVANVASVRSLVAPAGS